MNKLICDLCEKDVNVQTVHFMKTIQFDDSKNIYKSIEKVFSANCSVDLCNECVEKMQKGLKEIMKFVVGEVKKEEII